MYIFDSNILIYHLNDALDRPIRNKIETWIVEGAAVSVITRIEILGYPQTDDQRHQAHLLLSFFDEIALHELIVEQTIQLRWHYRIRVPDAIIAATAMTMGLPLVTRNEKDFGHIENLEIVNPFAM